MRFIDGEGVAKRAAGVALLHTGILSEELLCDGFGGGAENPCPCPVTWDVPAALDLACKCFLRLCEGFFGAV